MPLTFPSHAAAVLPLKLWRPRWFDGVALVAGSASPDLAYALDGSGLPVFPLSHRWPGLILFCLPVSLLVCLIVRRSAPVVSVHLPRWLRDYGVLGTAWPALIVTAFSAIAGAATHLAWDRIAVGPLDLMSTVAGGLLTVALLVHIGRSGQLRRWHGAPPAITARHKVFWPMAIGLAAIGTAAAIHLPGAFLAHTTGARVLVSIAIGCACAAYFSGQPAAPTPLSDLETVIPEK